MESGLSKRKCLLSLLRKGTSQWRCRWRRRRWWDDDDEDDIRVEVGTEKLAIVSGNCRNLNASRHQNIYWARKVVHFMTDSRWKYKWKYRQIEETREICALATYVIAYNFYRTTANQQGVKTRPHPAIRRGAVRKRGLHTINLWGSSQSQSQSQSFFFLPFPFVWKILAMRMCQDKSINF